jgi:hypothetical protein
VPSPPACQTSTSTSRCQSAYFSGVSMFAVHRRCLKCLSSGPALTPSLPPGKTPWPSSKGSPMLRPGDRPVLKEGEMSAAHTTQVTQRPRPIPGGALGPRSATPSSLVPSGLVTRVGEDESAGSISR